MTTAPPKPARTTAPRIRERENGAVRRRSSLPPSSTAPRGVGAVRRSWRSRVKKEARKGQKTKQDQMVKSETTQPQDNQPHRQRQKQAVLRLILGPKTTDDATEKSLKKQDTAQWRSREMKP